MSRDEREAVQPFLDSADRSDELDIENVDPLPEEHRSTGRLLYTSHFLSTWNSRLFEFGAFLWLAQIYPQTLLPASAYALSRSAAAALFSPWIGKHIDNHDRLAVVRLSIVSQRLAVASSCSLLFLLLQRGDSKGDRITSLGLLALLSVLACIEKLGSIMNTVSVERDWVVLVAHGNDDRLRTLNSQMRRIDLFCKLVGPLAISVIDSGFSSVAAVIGAGTLTFVSLPFEYIAIAQVYKAVDALRVPKPDAALSDAPRAPGAWMTLQLRNAFQNTWTYVKHQAFLPSFSLALLYLTVLSFNGQMITYLVASNVSSGAIGTLRGVSALFEMSATWLGPKLMERIGTVRAGIWFLSWQLICVTVACLLLWLGTNGTATLAGLVSAVISSRVGLWGFDLSAQMIVQEEVEPSLRGTFSSQEFSLQNTFEMMSFASTIIFARPEQFKYPATISSGAVALAGVLYAAFVRSRRGHLLHWSKCLGGDGKHVGHGLAGERLNYREQTAFFELTDVEDERGDD
ncbi:hypothetical protein MBLNU230_g4436t1 [Neophaeotheca triangularis]